MIGRHIGRRDHRDRLVPIGVELFANRVDGQQFVTLEGHRHQAQCRLDAFAQAVNRWGVDLERHLKTVAHRQQALGKAFDGELVGRSHVGLRAFAQVFDISTSTQSDVHVLGGFGLRLEELGLQ